MNSRRSLPVTSPVISTGTQWSGEIFVQNYG